MKTPRNKEEIDQVKEKILEGALDIITEMGFNNLTMRKLAQKIGMTAPNIYNYFSGKDELYINIVIRGFEMLRNDLREAYQENSDMISKVRGMIEAYLTFGLTKPRYYDIMFTLPTPKHNDYVGTEYEALSTIEHNISLEIADMVLKASADFSGSDKESESVELRIAQVWSLLHGMVSLYNSQIINYVVKDADKTYSKLIEEYVNIAANLVRENS